jgi:phosphoglycerate dehydrogenase-like enzyme
MGARIALLGPSARQLDAFKKVAPKGVDIAWVDSKQPVEKQAEALQDAVAVIATPSEFPVELAKACPNLKLVQVVSAGTDRIDIQALGELGIRVANNGGGNAVAVAEHTIALMVGVYRKLHLQFQSVQSRQWAGDVRTKWAAQAHELTGKTVGIIGFGRIGQRVARRLQGWECSLLYTDVVNFPAELEQELHVKRVSKDQLLKTSDIVTLHVPLTRHTRGMISDRELNMMKPTAILINCCRGPVVDEAALIRAVKAGKIAGAGLDVLEEEPTPINNALLDIDNVLVTPHMAGMSIEAGEKSRTFAMENVARVARGEEPTSIILPE